MFKGFILIGFITIFAIGCNVAPEYSLDFTPPANNSWPEDIYPAQINGVQAQPTTKTYGGTEATYGTNKSIYVARFTNKEEANVFFKQYIMPEFRVLSTSSSGTVNGQFYAKARGNSKKYFGWVNQRYIFVLKANSEADFDTLVANFKYIAKKSKKE